MNTTAVVTVTPVHPHIGAEIGGVDLSQPLPGEVFRQILAAFNEHSVLVFRDQQITDEQQVEFSRRFGPLEKNSFALATQNDYIYHISNIDDRGRLLTPDAKKRVFLKVNSRWHTDSSFKPVPAMASILSGREIPQKERADTEFASMRVGYETLDSTRREALKGLIGVHHYGYSLRVTGEADLPPEELDALPPVRQPLLRIHPGTGKPSLFVSGHIESIDGIPEADGRRLAEELVAWCTRPEYVYAHAWRTGDVVMWDNRCALHRAAAIPLYEIRRAHRTTIAGEGPVQAL